MKLPRVPGWLSFAAALAGSLLLIVAGNPLGWPLAVISVLLAAAYFFAKEIHGIAPGKGVRSALWGQAAIAALAASVILYIVSKNTVFSITAFLSLVVLLVEEIIPKKWSADEIRLNAAELAWAMAAAVFAWIFLTVALGTPSPIDVVTSCSMRPVLERGDMVILSGGAVNAPAVNYSGQGISAVKRPCLVEKGGKESGALCTESILVGNETVGFNRSNDIIVYEPVPRVTELIIHRAFAKLDGESAGYITRGDNNRNADQEAGIELVSPDHVHGKVLFRVPYLGYLKLFLFMQFQEPEGCDYIIKPFPQ